MSKKRKRLQSNLSVTPEAPKPVGYRVSARSYMDRFGDDDAYLCETYDKAVANAQHSVRSSLEELYKPTMTHQQLMTKYRREGTRITISPGIPGQGQNDFNDSNYASVYAEELIAKQTQSND